MKQKTPHRYTGIVPPRVTVRFDMHHMNTVRRWFPDRMPNV
ncbi:MAG TPA: hypothetical protein VFD64_10600 [Gemmatimonadaceae bacterium]|nr:hypothetical protein [Gemmatimonadaceae bacterium]